MATLSSILAWRIPWTEVDYNPRGRKESGTTERFHFHFPLQGSQGWPVSLTSLTVPSCLSHPVDLFKDEVRRVGRLLGMDAELLDRQPFPGPGLGVRILGEVTEEKIRILQEADAIVREEVAKLPERRSIWQAFAVLLPCRSVGVMGDMRTPCLSRQSPSQEPLCQRAPPHQHHHPVRAGPRARGPPERTSRGSHAFGSGPGGR